MTDELLAGLRQQIGQRALADHRPQGVVGVLGAVLAERGDLDLRRRPGHATRLAWLVRVFPAAVAAVLGADIALVLASEPSEQDRTDELGADVGGDRRVLAELLGADDHASLVDEGGSQDRILRDPAHVTADQVEAREPLQLAVVQRKRPALAEPVGHHAMRLDPRGHHEHRPRLRRHPAPPSCARGCWGGPRSRSRLQGGRARQSSR